MENAHPDLAGVDVAVPIAEASPKSSRAPRDVISTFSGLGRNGLGMSIVTLK